MKIIRQKLNKKTTIMKMKYTFKQTNKQTESQTRQKQTQTSIIAQHIRNSWYKVCQA